MLLIGRQPVEAVPYEDPMDPRRGEDQPVKALEIRGDAAGTD